ncbi:tetratricopeptide repeat protein [Rathayibacter tritici]|uniref:tetratricopeptide repeat protein n=1 Tax=Rathayibacter tritici TaxID=33888 RepID=UPI0009FEA7F3|nr:tetratricopeptide repeat protein [Rathayibacter tritici]PPI42796.1 hypothetical protein C5D18_12605 [Rathayibacter tritici]
MSPRTDPARAPPSRTARSPGSDRVAAFELGGAHDSAGHEAEYERVLPAGLDDERQARLRIQSASTLRNLGRYPAPTLSGSAQRVSLRAGSRRSGSSPGAAPPPCPSRSSARAARPTRNGC